MIEISGTNIKVVTKVVLNFLAKKGLLANLLTGGNVLVSKIPATAVSVYLRNAFLQNLLHLEENKIILISGEKSI